MSEQMTAEQSLTHHVALVLDNDYDLYQQRRELVQQALGEFSNDEAGNARSVTVLADALKDWSEELVDEMAFTDGPGAMLAREILTTALAWVDWRGLAAGYIAEELES